MPIVKFNTPEKPQDDGKGFVTNCESYAAVPFANGQYIIIHNGMQVHLSKSLDNAKSYITKQLRKFKK